jgi:hypothetical protein
VAKLLVSYLFIPTVFTHYLFAFNPTCFLCVQFVFLATLATALAAPGYVGAPLAAPVVAPYAYTAHAAYAAPLPAAYTGLSYPAYSPISAPIVSAAYYG